MAIAASGIHFTWKHHARFVHTFVWTEMTINTQTSILLKEVQYAFKDSMTHRDAIRITYRISLRSSSFQKPRYPSPIVIMVGQPTSTLLFYQPHDRHEANLLISKNDPSAGSPTETLLRLLLPLNDKVQWTSRDVAGGEPPTSPRSEHFTGPFNRLERRAVCTKGRDVVNAS